MRGNRKNKFILVLLILPFLFISYSFIAQPLNKDIFTVGDKDIYFLGTKTYIFNDTSNKLTINEIRDDSFSSRFVKSTSEDIHFEFDTINHWLKFSVVSNAAQLNSYIIEIRNTTIDYLQFYYEHDNELKTVKETGDRLPFNTRQVNNRNFAFNIDFIPNTVYTCYFRLNGGGDGLNMNITLYKGTSYSDKTSDEYIIYGIFYGVILTLLIATIIMVILNMRFKTHLYYVLYVLLIGLWNFNLDGLGIQYLTPDSPWLANKMIIILPLAGVISLAIFTIDFFDIRRSKPFLYKVITLINIIMFFLILLSLSELMSFHSYVVMLLVSGIVQIFVITATSISLYRKEPRLSLYYILSFAALIICVFIFSSNVLSGAFNSIFRDNALKIGFSFQVIILFVGLSTWVKIQQEQHLEEAIKHLKEINEVKQHANIELEKKVNDRTSELSNSNIELKTAYYDISSINTELKLQKEEMTAIRDKIEHQNELLEKRNQDIMDSINYAERIQKSIFPPLNQIKKLLPDSFIYLQPKEVLSGDFYWLEEFSNHIQFGTPTSNEPDFFLFAAVDCTGHGVPGALMSLVARNMLYHISKELHITSPSKILIELNQSIYLTLSNQHNEMTGKDGMDMALIRLDPTTGELQFAGAKNSLYIIRNGKLNIYKGANFSIGDFYNIYKVDMKEHFLQLQKGDVVYMFSDGFIDQIGGDNRKKLKHKRFRQILLDIHLMPMEDQKTHLHKKHMEWRSYTDANTGRKHEYEQIDDIMIIGFRY